MHKYLSKCWKLVIIRERTDSFNDIPALFGRFFRLSRQKQRARSRHLKNTSSVKLKLTRHLARTYVSRELRETVKHIKSVKVDGSSSHGIMPKSQSLPQFLDESRAFAPIASLCLESNPGYDGRRVLKFLFFVIPIRHLVTSLVRG